MSEIRVHRDRDHVVMATHHLHNANLSLKGKGLMSLMLSLPDEWDYSINGLVAISKENKTAIRSALKELQEAGYVVVTKLMPDKKAGRSTIKYEYDLYETPVEREHQEGKKQGTENLYLDNLYTENRPQYNYNQQTVDTTLSVSESCSKVENKQTNSARKKSSPQRPAKRKKVGYDEFVEMVRDAESYRLENCTEEQCEALMEAILPAFVNTKRRQDFKSQIALCRKTVDELYGYAAKRHRDYDGDIVYDVIGCGVRGKCIADKYMSYWFSDNVESFKASMDSMAENGEEMGWSKW